MGHQSWQEGFNFGGIWQPVELLDTDPVYISDVFIEPKLAEGMIEAHVELKSKEQGEGKVTISVRPWKEEEVVGQGETEAQFRSGSKQLDLHVKIKDPHSWSPDDPFLYVAEVRVEEGGKVRDQSKVRFGLREFTVKEGYFNLNGKRIFVKGGHHQGTYPTTLEYPLTREFADKEVRTIKEAGFNFCRLWVKPVPLSFLDAADELGLMLQEEPPLSLMEDSPKMLERSVREVREMVKRDRNRASIVIWNMINECDPPVKYVRQQCQVARDVDPTRLITESAGGPSHFYLPYSREGVSYLDEHPYPGAPIADDVYEYNRTRGVMGQLCFFSEYGYGGMNDVDSVLAKYGPHPKAHMEDYAGHVVLKRKREKAYKESGLLKEIFGGIEEWREACQTVQADTVRLHSEAMRANPAMGGYNYVQVFDSNAIEIDGLVDFWRDKRKKSFYVMQEVNKPLLLIIRCTPMNGRSGEETKVRVTLVNEEKISGQKQLRVRVVTPSGKEIFRKEGEVEAKPWVSMAFEGGVRLGDERGRYVVEAVLSEGGKELVRKEEYCTVFAKDEAKWPAEGFVIFDVDQRLEPYLKKRGINYQSLGDEIEKPTVIVATPFTALWRRPEQFHKFIRLFDWVRRGCTAVLLGIPDDGASGLLTGTTAGIDSFLGPLTLAHISPFSRIDATEEVWSGQRVGAYAWGLIDVESGVPIARHPIFEGIPQGGIMGREYGNVVPVKRIRTDWRVSEDTGSTVQIYSSDAVSPIGKGKIILTSLHLLPNLGGDALAEKLLSNLVKYAVEELPREMSPAGAYMLDSEQFEVQGYEDCFKKYLQKKR
jgi:beta-galactosidase